MEIFSNAAAWVRYLWDMARDFLLQSSGTGHKLILMVVVVLIFAGAMGLILFIVGRPLSAPRWLILLGFLGPMVIAIGFGLVYPAIRTIQLSFYNRNATESVGLNNYIQAFTQSEFQVVLRNTALWVILVPLLSTLIGVVYAVLIDRAPLERLSKTLMFMPMAISMVGASIIWRFMYEFRPAQRPQVGLLNQLLVWVGLEPRQFLLDSPLNTFFLIAVMVWIQAGFAMTILSAAIKAIPDDIVEAAQLDGVTGWEMFRHVTIPSIRPALVVVVTTIAMATLKVFDIVRTMTGGNFGTSVVANEFYSQSFGQGNTGMGAALAVILFILVVPIVIYNVRQMRLSEDVR